MSHRVLVVEPQCCEIEPAFTASLSENPDLCCEKVQWCDFCPEQLPRQSVDLLIAVAAPLTCDTAIHLQRLVEVSVGIPCLAVLPAGADDNLLRKVVKLADDFLLWPVPEAELRCRLDRVIGRRCIEAEAARSTLIQEFAGRQLVGKDPSFVQLVKSLPRIAAGSVPVLITGETGSGKELFARAIHHLGVHSNGPFVPVDCAAVPDHLFENELFGHVKGAFTGARESQKGLVALAETGTLFFDEVDSLSTAAQAKLLRFLEEQVYKRLGEERFRKANVNILAASNQNLISAVREKQFRSDLWFRLNVLQVQIPPLRERRVDILLLAQHHLEALHRSAPWTATSFSRAALQRLVSYDWPGNVRELFNVVQRAAVLADRSQILPSHLYLPDSAEDRRQSAETLAAGRARVVEAFDRNYLERMLRKHGGNITHAAREAGKERRAFGRLVKKYGIDPRTP